MGLCGAKMSEAEKEALKQNRALDRQNEEDFKAEQEVIKLLLLGAGESGKSTIFKQMKLLYGEGFKEEDRKALTPVVFNNIIGGMKTILHEAGNLHHEIQCKDAAAKFVEIQDDAVIDDYVGGVFAELWADPGIQASYEDRASFQLFDSFAYYANKIDDIKKDDYIPTIKDVLHSRVRTSGIVEEKYHIDGVGFVMYDVGGQRNERKKWIHCFDNVTAVIFVAAISEYDQVLYEDNTQARMDEALNLFEEICNSRWFTDTSMILFLNKRDLFEEKFFRVNFSDHIKNYMGDDNDMQAAKEHLIGEFISKNQSESKSIYHHITCATDTDNVEKVFSACKDIILKGNLKSSGFLD